MQDKNIYDLKILFIHQGWSERSIKWFQNLVIRHRDRGFKIESFCAVPNPPMGRYSFNELDKLWRENDKGVMQLYHNLLEKSQDYDVMINYNGANIHPEWLPNFPTFNIYICWDDPESSKYLSEPTAKFFDFSFTGNAACIPLYQSWGIKNCDFLPHACYDNEYDQSMTIDRINNGMRDIDIIFLGERESKWRKSRLDQLQTNFPKACMRGKGFKKGFLSEEKKIDYYSRSKIGWNIHNSIGPVNIRTFALPANGIMQICDNKFRLGHLFKLNEEVVGFDTIEECIELTKYFLKHDKKRKEIAIAGYERALSNYTETKQLELILNTIKPYKEKKDAGQLHTEKYKKIGSATSEKKYFFNEKVKRNINKVLRSFGYQIQRSSKDKKSASVNNFNKPSNSINPYVENPEVGPINISEKIDREKKGGFFEWPNMVALNWTVASMVGSAKMILEVGGGTGCFAYEVTTDPSKKVLCIDKDKDALNWADENRSRENIHYLYTDFKKITDEFDLVVAVDVIEHLKDYRSFLDKCISIAPSAIITTPNKNRSTIDAISNPPQYNQHVREWTAGELYWILRIYYKSVKLYSMTNNYIPEKIPIKITDSLTPIIAYCDERI